jgi:hypothetical protein
MNGALMDTGCRQAPFRLISSETTDGDPLPATNDCLLHKDRVILSVATIDCLSHTTHCQVILSDATISLSRAALILATLSDVTIDCHFHASLIRLTLSDWTIDCLARATWRHATNDHLAQAVLSEDGCRQFCSYHSVSSRPAGLHVYPYHTLKLIVRVR